MDFDEILNYEKKCYDKGYRDGLEKGKIQGHTEGRELGVQTGFQRYLSLGILQARVAAWAEESNNDPALANVAALVATPSLENKPDVVEEVDRRIKLAKNKCRTLAAAKNSPKIDAHEQKILYRREADDSAAIEDMY